MKTPINLLAITLLAVASCTDFGPAPSVQQSLDDIREAVFSYQISHNASGQQHSAQVYFLALYVPGDSLRQGHYVDPSDNLMARFRGNAPPVKKYSDCVESINGVFDVFTGAAGLLFRIESIREINTNEAEVTGGYFEAGLSASGNIYTVKRIADRWTVVRDVMLWIS